MAAVSLIVAISKYFGKKSGQTLAEFQAEVKALSEKDKAELTELLKAEGYEIQ